MWGSSTDLVDVPEQFGRLGLCLVKGFGGSGIRVFGFWGVMVLGFGVEGLGV